MRRGAGAWARAPPAVRNEAPAAPNPVSNWRRSRCVMMVRFPPLDAVNCLRPGGHGKHRCAAAFPLRPGKGTLDGSTPPYSPLARSPAPMPLRCDLITRDPPLSDGPGARRSVGDVGVTGDRIMAV